MGFMTLSPVRVVHLSAVEGPALAIHGGAGVIPANLPPEREQAATLGLERAVAAGRAVLEAGGPALDAVCAAVMAMEDCEAFNAGRGAALTAAGLAELDASVMCGDSRGGAVTCLNGARNPVLAARAVMEQSDHVLMASPSHGLLERWGLELVEPDYYVTELRRSQLQSSAGFLEYKHGTVGAVARDASGRLAAATSTGGITAQLPGRVGDTPLLGAGTWADDQVVAVSCTGQGELFVRGAMAHEVASRIKWAGQGLVEAVTGALDELVGARGGDGGLIAVTPSGELVLAHDAEGMYQGHWSAAGTGVGL